MTLDDIPLFDGLDAETRAWIAAHAQVVDLYSGQALYAQDSPPEAFYVILNGRLRAERVVGGAVRVMRELGRGEAMGGLSLMAEMPHRAGVRAVRDSQVLAVPPPVFERLLLRHPAFARRAMRTWLRSALHGPEVAPRDVVTLRTAAVLPAHSGAPVAQVAQELAQALGEADSTLRLEQGRIDSSFARSREPPGAAPAEPVALTRWLNDLETRHRYLIYQADAEDPAWTERCLRQSDRILLVVNGDEPARHTAMTDALRATEYQPRVELVVLGASSARIMDWRQLTGAALHHKLVPGRFDDYRRLARLLTGRAVGLALGGGGARGFAHLGLIRALRELGIVVDIVCGTSMGAFIGALLACGMDDAEMQAVLRAFFVDRNLLNDYTVPRVSLIRARKARKQMEAIFGDVAIEDVGMHYRCITTNLTRGGVEVHDHGRIAHWVGASMSVPGIAPPVIYRGDLLVDGSVLAAVPSDIATAMGRGPVIASDVSADEIFQGVPTAEEPMQAPRGRRLPHEMNIFQILYRAATLNTPDELRRRAERADLYLRMPVAGVGMFDWQEFERLIEAGYRYSLEQVTAWHSQRPEALENPRFRPIAKL